MPSRRLKVEGLSMAWFYCSDSRNNAVAVALAFSRWKLVPVSIADHWQLCRIQAGAELALPFKFKLDGFREVLL